ncbi:D-inositol-3-phosphate glycosyltransferase [Serratia liquefaciens]|uniref:glycosyltransferase family 4 protein n=1 Tax=Serratia liquefaciens TaxID=614 RepID=UPI0021787633|nr:glycosyltransferase family 1 protein [Serratia liquefaciens]CAI1599459.1 D-inositol-3-phosphate glycosyltransferase [Serratia liquefaciens]
MIYINGRFLTQKTTGVQRFAEEISKELATIRNDIVFLVPEKAKVLKQELISKFNFHEVKGGDGHFWEQISLPNYLIKIGSPLLINLCSTAPAFYKNKIVTHHDITYVKFPESFSKSFRLLYRTIVPIMIKNSKCLLTVSEFSKKEISNFYHCGNSRIEIISNAVNSEFKLRALATRGLDDNADEYALAVSSPNYHKNFHGLIDAFSSSDLSIKLKIIGDRAGNFSKVNFPEDDKRIEFLGRVSDKELVSLYQRAKFFVFPSFYEGFGIPPLEAQACGCPVISSDRASLKEVLEDSAIYFNPESKEDIIEALEIVNNDISLRIRLKQMGSKNITRFSWHSSAAKVNKIIEEII